LREKFLSLRREKNNFKPLLLRAMLRLKYGIIFKSKCMYLTTEKKREIFTQHGKNEQDTGSPEGQVALFTFRINHLTEHLKQNKKDHSTRRSLIRLVGKRRNLLDYLKRKEISRYRSIIAQLNLRK